MDALPAALALGLLAAGCADAHAQPRGDAGPAQARRDAGPARRWLLPSRAPLGSSDFRGDGGVPTAFRTGPVDDAPYIGDIFAGAAAFSASPPTASQAAAAGLGTIGAPARQGRFGAPESRVGVPLDNARMWLTVAEGWVLRCLERVRHETPFDVPVRFTVARDGAAADVAAEGAPDSVRQCLVEGLGHARFRPFAQPTELVARYRYTVRGRPSQGAEPRRAP